MRVDLPSIEIIFQGFDNHPLTSSRLITWLVLSTWSSSPRRTAILLKHASIFATPSARIQKTASNFSLYLRANSVAISVLPRPPIPHNANCFSPSGSEEMIFVWEGRRALLICSSTSSRPTNSSLRTSESSIRQGRQGSRKREMKPEIAGSISYVADEEPSVACPVSPLWTALPFRAVAFSMKLGQRDRVPR